MVTTHLLTWASSLVLLNAVSAATVPESSAISIPVTSQQIDSNKISSLVRRKNKSTSSATNAPVYNLRTEYMATVHIGTPAQRFNVILDTGSSDLWVPSNTCSKDLCPYNAFDPKKSSTYKDLNQGFDILYGTAYAVGEYGSDSVALSGVTVTRQQFAIVNETKGLYPSTTGSATQPDGILGLGYPGLTTVSNEGSNYNPLLFNMVEQKLIPKPVFSFSMGGKMANIGWIGELTLGGANPDRYTGDIEYIPVIPESKSDPYEWWQSFGQGFTVVSENGTVAADIRLEQDRLTVFDTGTTLTYVDMSFAKKIINSITGQTSFSVTPNAGIFVMDCKYKNTAARVQLALSHKTEYVIDKSPLIIDVPASSLVIPLDTEDIATAKICGWGIAGTADNSEFLIGQSLLRNTYLTFDMEKNQIGFSASSDTTTKVTSSSK
ncbi:hypothetical protein PS15p_204053 [Mucor circinelloides]